MYRLQVTIICPYNPSRVELSQIAMDAEDGQSVVVAHKIDAVRLDDLDEAQREHAARFFGLEEDDA